MSKSNSFENAVLLLVFNNTDIALIGDAAGLQNSASPARVRKVKFTFSVEPPHQGWAP